MAACTSTILAVLSVLQRPPVATRWMERRQLMTASFALAGLPAARTASATDFAELSDAQYAYHLSYPADWKEAPKPVKTHMHESLLSSTSGKGLKLGITVDPVKIDSLEAFGTLDQVTERVLAVEAARDGVQNVTLRANAAQLGDTAAEIPSYYTIEWATVSSRGKKLFSCKYCITSKKLYVLQVQASLDAFDSDDTVRSQVKSIVESFSVGSKANVV